MAIRKRTAGQTGEPPPLMIDAAQFERLQGLALAGMSRSAEVAGVLLEEVDRADILPSDQMPPTVVKIGSEVTFRDEVSGRIQTVRLVFPSDADIAQGRVSVLTPIGAALIGLSEGDRMTWEMRNGDVRQLSVLKVVQQEAATAPVAANR